MGNIGKIRPHSLYTYNTRYYFRSLDCTNTEVKCWVISKEGCICGCGSKTTLNTKLSLSGYMNVGQNKSDLMYHLKVQDNTQVTRWEI